MAIAQRFPTISISPVTETSVSSVTVSPPMSVAGERAGIMDTILVDKYGAKKRDVFFAKTVVCLNIN